MRETKQGQVEIIETLNNPAEVISRQKKTEVMEKYFRTLYTCAKQNNPPNDGLDSLLYLQEENGVNLDEIKITDEERRKSERHILVKRCNTNVGEANGVKSWLKKWNPYIMFYLCLAHRLNLTVKDAADKVDEVAKFTELDNFGLA
ncbi:Hypothetical predicted protein [Paramuricea clavata]|uniref:Uncharacterized protein n=1 Tax=Paramuricea clavata TaxID=317549 RepID=A0A7D9L1K5_PARCT|nr:Hypothetical predicted protein [Paramuricea clavata]